MTEIEERKKKWQIFYSPLSFIVLLIIFVLMLRAVWGIYNHELVSSRDRQRVEGDLADSNDRLTALQEQVADLSNPQGVDEQIRSKFNVAKPGEGVAVVVGGVVPTSSPVLPTPQKSSWQKFLGFFGL